MFRRLARFAGLCCAASALLAAPASADLIVYSNDFSAGAGAEWSDSSTVTSNGERFLGANQSGGLALGFGAGTDRLTLTGLAAHAEVVVSFDLYIIQSWDGNGPNGGGPDNFQVTLNGASLLLTSFANFTGGNTQSYPEQVPPEGPGGAFAPRTGQFEAGHLGFGDGDFGDATYRFSYAFGSTASVLELDFTSFQNQAPGDEGWGLDNVTVSIRPTAVPEPSTLISGGIAATALSGLAWRRRKRS